MTADLVLRGARVVDPADRFDRVADLYVSDGRILDVAPPEEELPAREVVDIEGLVVAPGLVDAHVHLREPGGEHKETVATGTRAALAGGFAAVACMPNTDPPLDRPERLAALREVLERDAACDVYPIAAAILDRNPERLSDFHALREAGAVAVSDDAMPLQHIEIMRRALAAASRAGLTFVAHPELSSAGPAGVAADREVAAELGVDYVGPEREAEGIASWGQAAEDLPRRQRTALHIAHVSSAEAVGELEAFAAARLLRQLTAETCPHYFSLTARALLDAGADAKMNPPLRGDQDVAAVRDALARGLISVIATDHAPHAPDEKARGLAAAPSGIVGLETALGLVLDQLVRPGVMSLLDALGAMTAEPARALGLPAGRLALGEPANLTLIDPEATWTVDPTRFHSKSRNTPFRGRELRGRAVMVYLRGRLVMQDGEVLV